MPKIVGGKKNFTLTQHWARDWRALALTQVHHWSRLKKNFARLAKQDTELTQNHSKKS